MQKKSQFTMCLFEQMSEKFIQFAQKYYSRANMNQVMIAFANKNMKENGV